MSARHWALAATACLVLVGSGCGDDDDGPLAEVEEAMAATEAGTIELELSASTGEGSEETGPVGFRLAGPFSFAGDEELAVFDLEYTRLLGSDEQRSEIRSTGEAGFLTVEGSTYRVPDDDAASLRLEDDGGGFGDLGIGDWATGIQREAGPEVDGRATERFRGEVAVGALLSDLVRLAGSVGGDEELEPLDVEAAERLQSLVRASTFEVIADAEDHHLRSLLATVDFGAEVPDALRASLGAYASPRLRVHLSLVPGPSDLSVEAPEDYQELP